MKSVKSTIGQLVSGNAAKVVTVEYKTEKVSSAANKIIDLEKRIVCKYLVGEFPPQSEKVDGSNGGSGKPWRGWVSAPFVCEHLTNGTQYLQVIPLTGEKATTTFWADGMEVSREYFAEFLTPAKKRDTLNPPNKPAPPCLTIKLDNLIDIRDIQTKEEYEATKKG